MSRHHLLALVAAVTSLSIAAPAQASTKFQPRVRSALGLAPPVGTPDVASGMQVPIGYHGGSVMGGGLRIHAIFWDGGVRPFQGPVSAGGPNYEGVLTQFLTDVAAASGASDNVFSVLGQYGSGTAPGHVVPGSYSIAFDPTTRTIPGGGPAGTGVILDHDAYPGADVQCASPHQASICVTDLQLRREVDRTVSAVHGQRGLHDIWFVFLPADVDECITATVCGSNGFAGYHSLADLGSGLTIYALAIDPVIESPASNSPGNDPQGYPDAETTIDTAAHEIVEAITDPTGTGWTDAFGNEVGDKCELGPQLGTPLGAQNGSPYNQLINGHAYQLQEMWSNADGASGSCRQRTAQQRPALPLPQVRMTQFSPVISGNIETGRRGVTVTVTLTRFNGLLLTLVAGASTTTAADGSWRLSLAPHAVGDDRDAILVNYSGGGAPANEVILTGAGGDPFSETGFMGWTAMDQGSFLSDALNLNTPSAKSLRGPSLTLAPCFQTGVLETSAPVASQPGDACDTQTDSSTMALRRAAPATGVTWTSLDNRRVALEQPHALAPVGTLVALTVRTGEAGSLAASDNPLASFIAGGFPVCHADLELRTVRCSGLVPGARYTLRDRSRRIAATAGDAGVAHFSAAIRRGETLRLLDRDGVLSTLHLADLRARVDGNRTVTSGGSCQPLEYLAGPLPVAPTVAFGSLTGNPVLRDRVCPRDGRLPVLDLGKLIQTDERSGGTTQTEVPAIIDTSPSEAATLYGRFDAVAETGLRGPTGGWRRTDSTTRVALSIARASGGRALVRSRNVDTRGGAQIGPLPPGNYRATWRLTDANGDTRTVTSRFVEEPSPAGL